MIRQIFILIVLTLTVSSVAYPKSDDPFERVKFISDFVSRGIGLPSTISDANIRAMGRVISVNVDAPYEAPHDKGVMIETRTYNLQGLKIVAHFVKGTNENGFITEAVVIDSKWKIEKGLNVGSSIDTVIRILGTPTGKSEKTYEYCGETSVDCATFEFSKNKVVKIRFTYYWD